MGNRLALIWYQEGLPNLDGLGYRIELVYEELFLFFAAAFLGRCCLRSWTAVPV